MLEELHAIHRLPSVDEFVSHCRLVSCARASAGKRKGTSGKNIGNAHFKWAFSEAAVLVLRHKPAGQQHLATWEHMHGQGKALPVLAPKLARAIDSVLQRDTVFDLAPFFQGESEQSG
jgi:hypothetical protein